MKNLKQRLIEYNYPNLCNNPEFKEDIDAATENSIKAFKEWLQNILLIHEQQKTLNYPLYYKHKHSVLTELIEEVEKE